MQRKYHFPRRIKNKLNKKILSKGDSGNGFVWRKERRVSKLLAVSSTGICNTFIHGVELGMGAFDFRNWILNVSGVDVAKERRNLISTFA